MCYVTYAIDQFSELSKCLLMFSNGRKVLKSNKLALDYLKAYGVNCYGNKLDKESYASRLDWFKKNEHDIINFDNLHLIQEADNKYVFIAFCFEYKNYLNSIFNGKDYWITHLPIQLDATCNGYQHLSFLTEDFNLSEQTNLGSSNKYEQPKDFYTYITLSVKYFISTKINEILKEWESHSKYK